MITPNFDMYQDIDLLLVKDQSGDINTLKGVAAIEANLKNIALTLQGSRRMLPTFAFGPTEMLFEPITQITAQNLGNLLTNVINNNEDRINLTNVNVVGDQTNKTYNVTVSYNVKAIGPGVVYTLPFILKQL